MITHNGWDVTNIAYFYLNPLISVIPRVFPLEQNISSCPCISPDNKPMILICLTFSLVNIWQVLCFRFQWSCLYSPARGVKSERRDNWATRVTLSSIPRAPGVTSSPFSNNVPLSSSANILCPVFWDLLWELKIALWIREERGCKSDARSAMTVLSVLKYQFWFE